MEFELDFQAYRQEHVHPLEVKKGALDTIHLNKRKLQRGDVKFEKRVTVIWSEKDTRKTGVLIDSLPDIAFLCNKSIQNGRDKEKARDRKDRRETKRQRERDEDEEELATLPTKKRRKQMCIREVKRDRERWREKEEEERTENAKEPLRMWAFIPRKTFGKSTRGRFRESGYECRHYEEAGYFDGDGPTLGCTQVESAWRHRKHGNAYPDVLLLDEFEAFLQQLTSFGTHTRLWDAFDTIIDIALHM